ncbi:hypothetical protein [Vibrio sp. FJH11]
MSKILTLFLFFLPMFSYANTSVEDKLFEDLNNAIIALGERITVCKESANTNNPDEETLKFAKQRVNELTPVLSHLNYLAFERCTLNEKRELAYRLLNAKNNARRHSTQELIKATEKITFSINTTSQSQFDSLDSDTKEFLENSDFFSKPFDVLGFYEKVADR